MKYSEETESKEARRKAFCLKKMMDKRKTLSYDEARNNKRAFIDLAMKLGPVSNEEYRGGQI